MAWATTRLSSAVCGAGSRRRLRGAALAATLVVSAAIGAPRGSALAADSPGSTTCTEAGVTWEVDWTFSTSFGGVVEVDGLKRNGVSDTQTWQLRWDNDPSQWPPQTPPASVVPFQQLAGGPARCTSRRSSTSRA